MTAEDGNDEYFLLVEDIVLCKITSLEKATFLWFAVFYIFDLSYNKGIEEFCLFFQEFIFGIPCASGNKTATYKSISTDIQLITFRQ